MSVAQMGSNVADWAKPIGFRCRVESEDEVLIADGGGELRYYVRSRSGRITVSFSQRGLERPEMATDSLLDTERYLTFTLGESMRSIVFERSATLRVPWSLDGVATGFEVIRADEGELSAVVLEAGVERARFRDYNVPYDAVPFTNYANLSIADLRASMLERTGLPAFARYVDQ